MTMNDENEKIELNGESAVQDVEPENNNKPNKTHLMIYDAVSVLVTSLMMILLVFTFAFRVVGVIGSSMTNTIHDGAWVLTHQKASYEYGDIIVITHTNYYDQPLIKRVIATEGQTVDIDYNTSTVYVDGKALYEPYTKDSYILPKADDIDFPYTVPEGHLFCMGDNRNGSTDSRSEIIGSLDERYVLGKVILKFDESGISGVYKVKGEILEDSQEPVS